MKTPFKQQPSTILGKVTDADVRPLANLKVKIYEVDMREWQPLADTIINREEKYELHWTHEQLSGRGKKTADIAVKIFTKEKNIVFNQGFIRQSIITKLESRPRFFNEKTNKSWLYNSMSHTHLSKLPY